MAKKKSASPNVSDNPAKKSTTAKTAASKSTAGGKSSRNGKSLGNGDASTAASALGADQIGMTAGSVWLYLSDNGPTSLTNLKKAIEAPSDLIVAAVGWLAREEKLEFSASGKSVAIGLK